MTRSSQLCEALEEECSRWMQMKKSIEVGRFGVFEESEAGNVARKRGEVISRDKQGQTVGRSFKYISSVTGSQWV